MNGLIFYILHIDWIPIDFQSSHYKKFCSPLENSFCDVCLYLGPHDTFQATAGEYDTSINTPYSQETQRNKQKGRRKTA